jgi:hypothetical protein
MYIWETIEIQAIVQHEGTQPEQDVQEQIEHEAVRLVVGVGVRGAK